MLPYDAPIECGGVPLAVRFFERDTESVARELLGKVLVSRTDEHVCGGRIVETEAYLGTADPGSHAAARGMTKRNRVMYGAPATAYVYLSYGCHHMLNLVTEREGVAGAVLIRALEPLFGVEVMRRRRGVAGLTELCSGPGRLAQALGVDLRLNGVPLGGELCVLDDGAPAERVATSGRIGLSRGHEAQLRFRIESNGYVSRGRTGPRRTAKDEEGQ